MGQVVVCETENKAIKQLCLGGRIVGERLSACENGYFEGTCYFLEIETVSDVSIRQCYRTERESKQILSDYFDVMSEKLPASYWRWKFRDLQSL